MPDYLPFPTRENNVDTVQASDVDTPNIALVYATAGYINVLAPRNGAVADGATDCSTAFRTADSNNGGTGVTVVPGNGSGYRFASNTTISFPIKIYPGSPITPDSGVTVTINGKLDAEHLQIFNATGKNDGTSGSGTVVLGPNAVKKVVPQWWGATPNTANDASTANFLAFSNAFLSSASSQRPVWISGNVSTTWIVHGQLSAVSGLRIVGKGATIKLDTGLSGTPNLINGSGLTDITIESVVLDGGSTTYNETDRNHVVYLPNTTRLKIVDSVLQHGRREGLGFSGADIEVVRCRILSNGQHGIWLSTSTGVTSKRVRIRDCTVLDWAQNSTVGGAYGIACVASTGSTATGDDIKITGNHVEILTPSGGAGSCIYVAGGQSATDGHTYVSHHVKVDGNTCVGGGNGNYTYQGASIEVALNCPGVSIQLNTVDAGWFDGISYGAGTGQGGNDPTVTGGIIGGNIVTSCLGAAGIEIEATNLLITGNQCLNNRGHGIYVAGVNSSASSFMVGSAGHTVSDNVCIGNGNNGICYVDCPYTSFNHNTCMNNGVVSGGGIVFQTQAADFEVLGCTFSCNRCFDTGAVGSTPASATATLTSGSVTSTTIVSGGSGYLSTPTIVFTPSPTGVTATGTVTVSSGVVTGITITSGGSGYTTAPTIIFQGGGVRTQQYGINSSASSSGSLSDGNVFEGNICTNNITTDVVICQSPTTPDRIAPSNHKKVLTFVVNPNFDPASYDEFTITLTGNITVSTISRGGDGEIIRIALTQDATGGRTVSWPTSFSFPGATAPTLSGANKTDIFTFQNDFAAGVWRQIAASMNMV